MIEKTKNSFFRRVIPLVLAIVYSLTFWLGIQAYSLIRLSES